MRNFRSPAVRLRSASTIFSADSLYESSKKINDQISIDNNSQLTEGGRYIHRGFALLNESSQASKIWSLRCERK
jgi:hypothetical protein